MAERSSADVVRARERDGVPGAAREEDVEHVMRRFRASRMRAIERHAAERRERRNRRLKVGGVLAGIAAVVATAVAVAVPALDLEPATGKFALRASDTAIVLTPPDRADRGGKRSDRRQPERRVPAPGALADAWRYAKVRGGLISIAVVDTRGRLRGEAEDRRYSSASVVKSMLLAAELRRVARERRPLDAGTESLLSSMITYSDNDAADAIYSRVGDAGLFEIARAARMERFTVAGHWGNAQIAAADMARMFFRLDRLMPARTSEFGKGLLGSVVETQSWGIPRAAGDRWAVRFKGGWIDHDAGALVHQVAELRDGDRKLSMAVLTDAQASQPYAIETIQGVAERLLSATRSRGGRSSDAGSGS